MRVPRVWFTVRRMMVAVAIVAVVMGLVHWMESRVEYFRARRDFHLRRWTLTIVEDRDGQGRLRGRLRVEDGHGNPVVGPRARREIWNYEMFKKYFHAAGHPWRPVAPDPPELE